MFERGYLTLFRLRGVPVRAHWSIPIGMLMLSGFRIAPGAWVSVLGVILLHELGHAFLVHRAGLVNLGIDITGIGGRCRWVGQPTEIQRAGIAWGGVLAQLLVLAIAGPIWLLLPAPGSELLADLLDALTRTNLILIVLNLIPFPPLDGAEAWPFFTHWRREAGRRRKWKKKLSTPPDDEPPQTLREALDEADRRRGG